MLLFGTAGGFELMELAGNVSFGRGERCELVCEDKRRLPSVVVVAVLLCRLPPSWLPTAAAA